MVISADKHHHQRHCSSHCGHTQPYAVTLKEISHVCYQCYSWLVSTALLKVCQNLHFCNPVYYSHFPLNLTIFRHLLRHRSTKRKKSDLPPEPPKRLIFFNLTCKFRKATCTKIQVVNLITLTSVTWANFNTNHQEKNTLEVLNFILQEVTGSSIKGQLQQKCTSI